MRQILGFGCVEKLIYNAKNISITNNKNTTKKVFFTTPYLQRLVGNRFRKWFGGNFVIIMDKMTIYDTHSKTVIENRLKMFCLMKFMSVCIK